MIFSNPEVRERLDLKIFLDTDDDIRLSRKVYKDVYLRKKTLRSVIEKYLKQCKTGFEKYTLPFKKYADIIIPNYGEGYSTEFNKKAP